MKKFTKLASVAMCFTLAVVMLAACGKKAVMPLPVEGIDFYRYTAADAGKANYRTKMTVEAGTGEYDGWFIVKTTADNDNIGVEVSKFLEDNAILHKDFTFTAKMGTSLDADENEKTKTAIGPGYAWEIVTHGSSAEEATYRKYGTNDAPVIRDEVTPALAIYKTSANFAEFYIGTGEVAVNKDIELTFKAADKDHVVKIRVEIAAPVAAAV